MGFMEPPTILGKRKRGGGPKYKLRVNTNLGVPTPHPFPTGCEALRPPNTNLKDVKQRWRTPLHRSSRRGPNGCGIGEFGMVMVPTKDDGGVELDPVVLDTGDGARERRDNEEKMAISNKPTRLKQGTMLTYFSNRIQLEDETDDGVRQMDAKNGGGEEGELLRGDPQ